MTMTSAAEARAPVHEAPVLAARSLSKVFGSGATAVTAVRDLSMEVAAGEVVLVMGPSGSGKTTLLLMLGALMRPTSGSIQVTTPAGVVDIAATPERSLPTVRAHTFGFVFQDYALLSALTAAENVAIAGDIAGMPGHRRAARVADLLERVGLGSRARARPAQLSGGEQQRVAIARALVNDPPVLLADEPTANLDSAHGRDIALLLRRLADEDRRAIIVVSHDERLREIADRVLWLEDGMMSA